MYKYFYILCLQLALALCFFYTSLIGVSSFNLPTPAYNYTLRTTWDNKTTSDNAEIYLSFQIVHNPFRSLLINIDAPFYNDPLAPEGNSTSEPFPGLWDYEVVEAFFLGENEEYLEIELAPSAHHLLLYLKGYRNDTSLYLPLTSFSTQILNGRWTGEASIPAEYFPCNVTRFNAYAIHKSDPDRVYMSLFPAPELDAPDFHYFPAFRNTPFPPGVEISPLCTKHMYTLNKTWNGNNTLDNAEIYFSFSILEDDGSNASSLLVEINAPFYNDPQSPELPNEDPFPGLWDYEVFELFFLGDEDEYLEIELAPSGHYLLLYLNGYRNDTGRVLPLTHHLAKVVNTTTPFGQQRWIAEAKIPSEYFPCNVTKFNAYAIHNSDPDRVYMSLFPATEGELEAPDFHYLEGFGNVEFESEINRECNISDENVEKENAAASLQPILVILLTFFLANFIFI